MHNRRNRWLAAGGDRIVVRAGRSDHRPAILSSGPGTVTVPFDHLAAERALAAGADLSLGDGPGQTRVLCASYHQDPAVAMPLLTLLPDVLQSPPVRSAALDTTLRLLAGEISRPERRRPR